MNDQPTTASVPPRPELPARNLRVDYGAPAPGSAQPMPESRRNIYESRIRNSVAAQAAGAEKASQLFVRLSGG